MSNLATIVNNILADSGIDDINVVVTNGSYSNPAWITALSWSKITSTPTTLSGYGITDAVPANRTITINGDTQDLSANRTWTIAAGVTSVSAGTGISVNQTTGAVTVTNTGVLSINGSTGAVTGILTTSNYNSYAPTLTGGGASGTWGINITGDAGSLDGIDSTGFYRQWTAPGAAIAPATGLNAGDAGWTAFDGYGGPVPNYPAATNQWWVGLWQGGNEGRGIQLAGGYADTELYYRKGATSWQSWIRILNSSNYTEYAVQTTTQSNWNSYSVIGNVVGMLAWKNYGNGHVIFDASQSTSPTGSSVNNTNATYAWTGTYPTLMGWNGSNTYGVRVDSARISDNTSGNSATTSQTNFTTLTLNSATVATQSWVNSQGFVTGGPYLPLSGGTVTGATVYTGTLFARKAQTAGNYTTAALWTESYDLTTTGIAFHISNVMGKFLEMRTDGVLYWHGDVVLHSGNYNSYSPTLTGVGASGTWGINISGNASTSTSTTYINHISLGSSTVNINSGSSQVLRNENGLGAAVAYAPLLHLAAGDTMWQIQGTYGTSGSGTLYFRQGYNGSWGTWLTMLSSANYTSFSGILRALYDPGALGFNNVAYNSMYYSYIDNWANKPTNATYPYGVVLTFDPGVGSGGRAQMYISHAGNDLIFRGGWNANDSWQAWNKVLTENNYNSYAPTLTGGGASGTWGINITGSSQALNFGGGTVMNNSAWAGTGGYHGYTYSGGNFRFGFSSTSGVIDVYADGNFYATDNSYLVLHSGNYSSYALPLTGGTLTGTLFFSNNIGTCIRGTMGNNDFWRIYADGADNSGYLEIATADDGAEPIYISQYSGVFTTLTRRITLLDGSGNTTFPGTVSVSGGMNVSSTANWFGGYGSGSGPGISLENQNTFARFAFFGLDFYDWDHGVVMTLNSNYVNVPNYLQAGASLKAPIFYDSVEPGYYLDPNSISNLRALTIGEYTQIGVTLPYPGANYGNGIIYIRLHPVQGRIVSLKIDLSSTWNWAAAFGYISADVSYYCDGTNLYYATTTVTSATGQALNSIHIGNPVIENGYVSIPVYSSNSNGISCRIVGSPSFDWSLVSVSGWSSVSFPGANAVNVPGTMSIGGSLSVSGNITLGGNQVLHAGNYSSYALPLSGGTISGNLTINGIWQTNISTQGGWSKLSFTASSAWGDGVTYGVLGAGGDSEPGVMVYNMHATWASSGQGAGVRMGRSGGVSSGAWYQVATMASDEFMIAKTGDWGNGGIKILSNGAVNYGNTGYRFVHNNGTWDISINGNAATATTASNSNAVGGVDISRIVYGDNATKTANFGNPNDTLPSGFWNNYTGTNVPYTSWWHMIINRHSNTANNYQLQIAAEFWDNGMYFRKMTGNNVDATSWARIVNSVQDPYAANMNQYVRTTDSPTFSSNLYISADGSTGYVASRIWMYSHNNYRGAGVYLSGTNKTWFAGTPYTDFEGLYIIARTDFANDETCAQVVNRRWSIDSGGNSVQTGTVYATSLVDYNDNTYYLDPNSGSYLRGLVTFTGGHYNSAINVILRADENGAAQGQVTLRMWCSEPGITWSWAGFGYNVTNDGGSPNGFSRINSNFGQAYMRFSTEGSLYFYNTNTSGTRSTTAQFGYDGVATFYSSVYASAFYESSDRRIKDLIEDNYRVNDIETIRPKLYKKNGKIELGYYAQDVQPILSNAVTVNEDGYLNLSYREVHTAKIAYLEDSIEEIKAKILYLENQLKTKQ